MAGSFSEAFFSPLRKIGLEEVRAATTPITIIIKRKKRDQYFPFWTPFYHLLQITQFYKNFIFCIAVFYVLDITFQNFSSFSNSDIN